MTLLDKITEKVLAQIDDTGFTQSGAFNLRPVRDLAGRFR